MVRPLRQRPVDLAIVCWFAFNLVFITYIADVEQLVIPDPTSFEYPWWPPRATIDANHAYARAWDPILWQRPTWFRAVIWIDVLVFGPFYAAAIYAFARGREWIRQPTIVWASMILTTVSVLLFVEMFGEPSPPSRAVVLGANAPWVVVPLLVLARVWRAPAFAREG